MPDLNNTEIEICLRLSFDLWTQESDYILWLFSVETAIKEFKGLIHSRILHPMYPGKPRPLPLTPFVSTSRLSYQPSTTWNRPNRSLQNNQTPPCNYSSSSLLPPTPITPATSATYSLHETNSMSFSQPWRCRRLSMSSYHPYSVPRKSSISSTMPISATSPSPTQVECYSPSSSLSGMVLSPRPGGQIYSTHPPLLPLSIIRANTSKRSLRQPRSIPRIITTSLNMGTVSEGCSAISAPLDRTEIAYHSHTIDELLMP
jgi:hypothetical protein